jgi:hypothetical protein
VLNENDDLNWLPGETAAAMRDLARTVTDAPPLRLTAEATGLAPARPRRRPRGPRFRWTGGAPLLAAAAVVAAAVTLVIVKDLPTGQLTPTTITTTSATAPGTAAGGLPEYYVALHPVSADPGAPNGLIVGDTVTGKTVAVVAPPAATTLTWVSAAADDRTFAVVAAPASGGPGLADGFYLLTITPGGAPVVRLSQLPIEPLAGVIAAALSSSGKELAIATATQTLLAGPGTRTLDVYSVVTGRALRSWSTTDTSAIVSLNAVSAVALRLHVQYPALTWINGDTAIAFPVIGRTHQAPAPGWVYSLDMRSLDITAPGHDLMADSKVIANLGSDTDIADLCGTQYPAVSGNGTVIFCVASGGPDGHTSPTTVRWVIQWRPVSTSLADNAEFRLVMYVKVIGAPAGSAVYPATVWSSSTGERLLIEWQAVTPDRGDTAGRVQLARFGELTAGNNGWTFTPLPSPAIFAAAGPFGIAW